MALARVSPKAFLAHAKSALRAASANSTQRVTIVIGNESAGLLSLPSLTPEFAHMVRADLDSMASAILFAYIRSTAPRPPSPQPAFSDLYIPVTNIPSADIRLRKDFLALLPRAGLEEESLITLDDLTLPLPDLATALRPENTSWILVDHNALQGRLGELYSDRVVGVIDHHEDEGLVPQDTGPEPRVVQKSGSCTSLVTEHCREAWDALSASAATSPDAKAQSDTWDAQLATLALGPVLVDTTNLTSEAKVTEHDIRAADYLEAKIRAAPTLTEPFNRKNFHREINTAKKNIDDLAFADILRKDYKQWTERGEKRLGISSVVKPLAWQVAKAGLEAGRPDDGVAAFLDTVRRHSSARGLAICAIMTSSKTAQGASQRELFAWALDTSADALLARFEERFGPELGLERLQDASVAGLAADASPGAGPRRAWRQREVSMSRKLVSPLLRAVMNE
ncbi:MAG: Exopolyphosphatase [Thelocarpon impressellum]|nr:MAG: Exopolyphosphatase [Thelocarpon impressellum]